MEIDLSWADGWMVRSRSANLHFIAHYVSSVADFTCSVTYAVYGFCVGEFKVFVAVQVPWCFSCDVGLSVPPVPWSGQAVWMTLKCREFCQLLHGHLVFNWLFLLISIATQQSVDGFRSVPPWRWRHILLGTSMLRPKLQLLASVDLRGVYPVCCHMTRHLMQREGRNLEALCSTDYTSPSNPCRTGYWAASIWSTEHDLTALCKAA